LGSEGGLIMEDIATLDTGTFHYQDLPYAEIASSGNGEDEQANVWRSGNELFFLIQKKGFQQTGISVWNEEDEPETDEKAFQERIEREKVRNSIKHRISTLKRLGLDDGITPSEKSGKFLFDFFSKRMIKNEPLIFLLENGNFRALWEGENGEQIGLQFLPERNIQFVIFARRPDRKDLARSFGSDTPEGINRHVEINRLRSLFYS